MSTLVQALRRAVVSYLVIGLVLVACSSVSFSPLRGTSWQQRGLLAGQEILTWPRLLPAAAQAMGLLLPGMN